jgi:hypothetical protein
MGIKALFAGAAAAAAFAATGAGATVIGFDDLSTSGCHCVAAPNGYQGLDWTQIYIEGEEFFAPVSAAVVSPEHVGVSSLNGGSFQTANGDDFVFESAYITGDVYHATDQVQVIGYRDGAQVYSTAFNVLGTAPTLETFGWTVDKVYFNSTYHAAFLDDITLSGLRGAVPEPATWALGLIGMGGVGATLRRKRRSEAARA